MGYKKYIIEVGVFYGKKLNRRNNKMSIIKEILYRIRGEYTTRKLISMGMKVGKTSEDYMELF